MRNKKLFGFTLAEVLITLAIIGVVATLTLPTLITNYQKKVVETKLIKFYSTINQSLQMASANYGNISDFVEHKNYTYLENLQFAQKYILPYLVYDEVFPLPEIETALLIKFKDKSGMLFRIDRGGADIGYFVDYENRNSIKDSRNKFMFQFDKTPNADNSLEIRDSKNFIEPYIVGWDKSLGIEGLKSGHERRGCYEGSVNYGFCAKIIQLNDWKIPKDYPW